MNKTVNPATLPTPTPEEIAFYIREGKRLQSVAVHGMLRSTYRIVMKTFSAFGSDRDQHSGKSASPLSGYHVHGN